jgi:sortase A
MKLERAAWAIGAAALTVWAAVSVAGTVGARWERERFAEKAARLSAASSPDLRLWSLERVRTWQASLTSDAPAPLAVLRIPRLGVDVAVLEGTGDWTLNRAVGHIEDTALPGAEGNTGIAGHRDGFFRALKDIRVDDVLELDMLTSIDRYRVERAWIVTPEDVSVLDPTPTKAVTLVTCYPFYFVGSAPQRFIVRAIRTDTRSRQRNVGG